MHTAALYDDKLYIFGGYDGGQSLKDCLILDTTTMLWSQPEISGERPPPLMTHTCNVVGDRLYMFGGIGATKDDNGHTFLAYNEEVYVRRGRRVLRVGRKDPGSRLPTST